MVLSSSPVRPVHRHLETETTSALPPEQHEALNDYLLEEIFLRIACPADLLRASAACTSFHRLITNGAFLRRYRSHHRPQLLGFLDFWVSKGFLPVKVPHPNAPSRTPWPTTSSPNSSLSSCLSWRPGTPATFMTVASSSQASNLLRTAMIDLVMCDPISGSRRYLPPMPSDQGLQDFGVALFAPCDAGDNDETSFRVNSAMYYETKLAVSVFDSASGSWTVPTSAGWDALSLSNGTTERPLLTGRCYAYSCFYWKVHEQNKLLKLDIDRMDFSTTDLPPGHEDHVVVIVEMEELGILASVVTIVDLLALQQAT
ncbi:hypothetical protein QOZ80_8BG0650100 [Eleusine coracana subsp. coracana]|nr:hypothetical protein QOZ80_8BG0650100 [Eleusine coracana subsp. coracana]